MSGLANIIPSILETSNATDDLRAISCFIFCCLSATGGLEPVISLASKFALGLGNVRPGFYLKSSAYSVLDDLGVNILFDKIFPININSLASENSAALLFCSSLRNNIFVVKFCMPNPAVSRLSHTAYIAQ